MKRIVKRRKKSRKKVVQIRRLYSKVSKMMVKGYYVSDIARRLKINTRKVYNMLNSVCMLKYYYKMYQYEDTTSDKTYMEFIDNEIWYPAGTNWFAGNEDYVDGSSFHIKHGLQYEE